MSDQVAMRRRLGIIGFLTLLAGIVFIFTLLRGRAIEESARLQTAERVARNQYALHQALFKGDAKVVGQLIDDPHGWDRSRAFDPLAIAAFNGHSSIVELLISRGWNPMGIRKDGDPLVSAASKGKLPVIKVLLKYGANPNSYLNGATPLSLAACKGDCDAAKALLDAGAEVDGRSSLSPYFEDATPLILAADRGQLRMLRLLLSRGANPSLCSKNKMTAKDAAQINRHSRAVKVLSTGFPK